MPNMMSQVFFALWISCLSLNAPAQSPPDVETLTLEKCIVLALEQNPLLQSSQQIYQASLARIHRAKAFSQPNIDFDSDLQPSLFDFNGSRESYIGLSQNIDFPGKRSTRGKIATRESLETQADIGLLKLDVTYQVKEAFYGLLLAQQILKYAEQDLELSRDYLQKAEIKHEAGDVAMVEVLRARVETAKAENSVRAAVNEVRLGKARLNFLLARKKYEPLEIAGEFQKQSLHLSLEELKLKALAFRPEISRLGFSLEKEDLRKSLAQMSYLPDFSLGISRHSLSGVPTTWDFTLSFPIPLFFWQPQKGEITEAQANLEALRKEKEYLINAISLEVEEAYANAMMTRNQIELFEKEILAQAEEAYNMFLFSFQEGEIGGIELIEARRTLIEARKSYADALHNFSLALAALEKSIGQELEVDTHD
jgi:cobalt-zinc-cadmium efflux system outer membrane protein